MRIKHRKKDNGRFWSCSRWPRCKGAKSYCQHAFEALPHPTSEQLEALTLFRTGDGVSVRALAGSGKTTSLEMIARIAAGPVQYVAFNKQVVRDARKKFGHHADCCTMHSLAMRAMNVRYRRVSDRPSAAELARKLNCAPILLKADGHDLEFSGEQIAEFARLTVAEFAKTTSRRIGTEHVAYRTAHSLSDGEVEQLARHILPYARKLWRSYGDSGSTGYSGNHQIYLKRWQLGHPHISATTILFDEAQDADPVMLDIIRRQTHAQIVYCGDPFQSIYEWRGAVDAMDELGHVNSVWLTETFRFGSPIAEVAQFLLSLMDCPATLKTIKGTEGAVGVLREPRCVICRTNFGVLDAVSDAHAANLSPHLLGNLDKSLITLLDACEQLQSGEPTSHHLLSVFPTWRAALDWANHDDQESDYDAALLRLISSRSTRQIRFLLGKCIENEARADIVITTVHQAKGREFETVKIADDFRHYSTLDLEELRVAYVAVTRAKRGLDVGSTLFGGEDLFRNSGSSRTPIDAKPTAGPISQEVDASELALAEALDNAAGQHVGTAQPLVLPSEHDLIELWPSFLQSQLRDLPPEVTYQPRSTDGKTSADTFEIWQLLKIAERAAAGSKQSKTETSHTHPLVAIDKFGLANASPQYLPDSYEAAAASPLFRLTIKPPLDRADRDSWGYRAFVAWFRARSP